MASSHSQIPDLRTLLGDRANRLGRAPRGRGGDRGGGRGGPGASHEQKGERREHAVRSTDQDAAGSRVSCVELGYLEDPFAKLFATQPSTRRLPLLNRGTYVRTSALDLLISKFLSVSPSSPKQIVSLGAGTDTRYFRILEQHANTQLIYHEIDFPTNTATKLASIFRHADLHTKLPKGPSTVRTSSSYCSESYNLHALDLRQLAERDADKTLPELPNLDPHRPTLILSEMCLIYLQSSMVSSILSTLTNVYLDPATPASLILYEPILPNDAFGRTMISNLSTRNIHLPTLTAYPELGDQRARLKQYGLTDGYKAVDTEFIWKEWVPEEEKERVAGLEFLDELEELELLLRHYCVAWGWRDGGPDGIFSKAWANVREQEGG